MHTTRPHQKLWVFGLGGALQYLRGPRAALEGEELGYQVPCNNREGQLTGLHQHASFLLLSQNP